MCFLSYFLPYFLDHLLPAALRERERKDSHLDLDDARFPKAQLLMNMDLFFGPKETLLRTA